MKEYPIVLELEEDGRYSVSAPDLPGCVSWGEDRTQAIDHIREAIELWIESAKADGEPVPVPGSTVAYVKVAS
jgi:predicted RNase H-like HicB family nuclease